MDFDEAIKAHTFWKVTLRWMINGQRPLDAEKLGCDYACELGRWIHGDGLEYRQFSAYQKLVREHSRFHAMAAEVAGCIAAGDSTAALRMLGDSGAFSLASAQTIAAIHQLRREVEATESSLSPSPRQPH